MTEILIKQGWILGWLKIWSYLNLVSLAGEMIPFPSLMITLKSGGNQMKFTHGRNPPSFPIENVQEGFWPLQLPIFYNGNGVGLRPWVNFVWSSPDFRVTIYDGNGHISPARKTRFGFDHILSHPIGFAQFYAPLKVNEKNDSGTKWGLSRAYAPFSLVFLNQKCFVEIQ